MCLGTFLYKTVLLTPTEYHAIILSIDSCVVFAYFAGTKSVHLIFNSSFYTLQIEV